MLRSNLVAERARLEARLKAINQALGGGEAGGQLAAAERVEARESKRPGRPRDVRISSVRRVIQNRPSSGQTLSLKQAVIIALQGSQKLSREELVIAVVEAGYRFTATNPLDSLSTFVFGNRNIFRIQDGLVSLV